ncbi:uncharacterized protein LOC111408631 [Olea europaea var. sylvestris]|uniref:uncharacterized protein LOC111408631 n=1 Tax=Olea europaea var. sylvestris TaxID=158386 RepID=UPI000C1D0181|nr:uncharacterized protein LOC111408631 [Olea europaea var. sylvestris]
MEKYFKRKSTPSCDEQNIIERNDREKRDQNNVDIDVGDVDVGDVGGIGDVGDVGGAYVQRGPCQPRNHAFPPTRMGNKDRRFCISWYTWLEYSIAKDAVFCFYCYLFSLSGGLAICGHDESEDSNNQGNFLELLHWLCDHNAEIKVVALTNALENYKLTSPRVQKDIVGAITSECLHVIIKDVCDSFFSILVDESRDISVKEKMLVVIHYVNNGCVLEHFIGVIHVLSTTVASFKVAIDQLFLTHSLSISNLRD